MARPRPHPTSGASPHLHPPPRPHLHPLPRFHLHPAPRPDQAQLLGENDPEAAAAAAAAEREEKEAKEAAAAASAARVEELEEAQRLEHAEMEELQATLVRERAEAEEAKQGMHTPAEVQALRTELEQQAVAQLEAQQQEHEAREELLREEAAEAARVAEAREAAVRLELAEARAEQDLVCSTLREAEQSEAHAHVAYLELKARADEAWRAGGERVARLQASHETRLRNDRQALLASHRAQASSARQQAQKAAREAAARIHELEVEVEEGQAREAQLQEGAEVLAARYEQLAQEQAQEQSRRRDYEEAQKLKQVAEPAPAPEPAPEPTPAPAPVREEGADKLGRRLTGLDVGIMTAWDGDERDTSPVFERELDPIAEAPRPPAAPQPARAASPRTLPVGGSRPGSARASGNACRPATPSSYLEKEKERQELTVVPHSRAGSPVRAPSPPLPVTRTASGAEVLTFASRPASPPLAPRAAYAGPDSADSSRPAPGLARPRVAPVRPDSGTRRRPDSARSAAEEASPRPQGGALSRPYTGVALSYARKHAAELRVYGEQEKVAMDQARRDPNTSSRTPWLMRDAIGHSDVLGIRTLVRPALCAAPAAQVRPALRQLFAQQKALQSQRALDNWELLGAAAQAYPLRSWLLRFRDEMQSEQGDTRDGVRRQVLAQRLDRLLPLLGRQHQRQAWLAEIWALRGQVMAAVRARLLTHTLHGLTKLTDAANVQSMGRQSTPRSKHSDALALSIFSGQPVLPFSSLAGVLHGGDAYAPLDAAGVDAAAAPDDLGISHVGAAELWALPVRRQGLSTAQLQRIVVTQGYWPRDFVQMSARLQRQVPRARPPPKLPPCPRHPRHPALATLPPPPASSHPRHPAPATRVTLPPPPAPPCRHPRQVLADAMRYCLGELDEEQEASLLFGEEGPPPEPKASQRPWHLEPTEQQPLEVSRRNTKRCDDRPQTSATTRPRAASPRVRVAGAPVASAPGPRPYTRD